MSESQSLGLGTVLRQLALHADQKVTDADLLSAFVEHQDVAAFEAILRRYGDLVFGVCRRVLHHQQDTEDAFQATFLVLFLKASSIQDRQTLPCWLYGVAYRTAMNAKMLARRRTQKENQMSRPLASEVSDLVVWGELESILDQEIQALPEKYRRAIILCDFEGKSRKEAAHLLQCKEGTLSGHLTRGHRLLAQRLQRYGLHWSVPLFGLILAQKVSAEGVSYPLLHQTIDLIRRIGLDKGLTSELIPNSIVILSKGVLKSMLLSQIRSVTTIAFAAITALIVGLSSFPGQAAPVPTEKTASSKEIAVFSADWKVNNLRLFKEHKVFRELKCTLEQREKIEDILDAAEEKVEVLNEKSQNLVMNPRGGVDLQNVYKEITETINKEAEKTLKEIQEKVLKPEQVHRLRQIDLQMLGSLAFTDPKVIQTLRLTDKQKEDIQTLRKKAIEALKAPIGAGANPAQPLLKADTMTPKELEKMEQELVKSVVELFTKEQRSIWDEMVGKPVKLRKTSFGVFDEAGGFAQPTAIFAPVVPNVGVGAPPIKP